MSRFLILLLGLIALSALAFLCINKYSPIIEDDLSSRTQQALELEDIDYVNVGVDGRELYLDGYVPNANAKEQAEKIALGINGVRTVKNQLVVESAGVDSEATALSPSATQDEVPAENQLLSIEETPNDIPQVLSKFFTPHSVQTSINNLIPYKTEFIYEKGKLTLSGLVADQSAHVWLVNKAEEQFGRENIDDQLRVFYGAPQGWHNSVGTALMNLPELDKAHAIYLDKKLSISANASSQKLAEQVQVEIEKGIGNQTELVFDIEIEKVVNGKGGLKASEGSEVHICQNKFNKTLKDSQILFDSNKAVIKQKSYKLLDQLVTVAKECSKISIEVGGHTDSRGKAEYNQWLSESRAKAVVTYLRKHGVTSKKLSAKGYGELKPMAKNDTAEGMSKNRRIEFKVGGS